MISDLVADSTKNVHFQMCKKCAKCFRIYRKTLKTLLKNAHSTMCKQMCKKCASKCAKNVQNVFLYNI